MENTKKIYPKNNDTPFKNGTLINRGSWVAYFVASFCFESMSLAG